MVGALLKADYEPEALQNIGDDVMTPSQPSNNAWILMLPGETDAFAQVQLLNVTETVEAGRPAGL